jgi:putative polyhydroxyalkanoate system protein
MSKIHIHRTHTLGKVGARREVEEIAKQLKERLQADYHWHGDQLHFERSGAEGRIEVGEDDVDVNIELGLMLSPMKGMIQKQVEEYLDARLR